MHITVLTHCESLFVVLPPLSIPTFHVQKAKYKNNRKMFAVVDNCCFSLKDV